MQSLIIPAKLSSNVNAVHCRKGDCKNSKVVAHNSSKFALLCIYKQCSMQICPCSSVHVQIVLTFRNTYCFLYIFMFPFDCLQAAYDQLHAQVPCSDRADHVMLCPGAGPAGRLLQRGQHSEGSHRLTCHLRLFAFVLKLGDMHCSLWASVIYNNAAFCSSVLYVRLPF